MLVLALLAALLLAGCGDSGSEPAPEPAQPADREAAWLALLEGRGLEAAQSSILVEAKEDVTPDLEVALTVPADAAGEVTFADALYGAEAFTFEGAWRRVDTAEIRAQIAPVLRPGEKGTFELPVEEAESYRVLVPVAGRAAWGDALPPP